MSELKEANMMLLPFTADLIYVVHFETQFYLQQLPQHSILQNLFTIGFDGKTRSEFNISHANCIDKTV